MSYINFEVQPNTISSKVANYHGYQAHIVHFLVLGWLVIGKFDASNEVNFIAGCGPGKGKSSIPRLLSALFK